jgi:DNA-directed RNA polymerase subunit alpha
MLCVDKVLKHHPNHQKALLFKRDIESSMTMCYDEDKMKKKERKNQILETPISDFELSVRSRNCLRKMNIQKIGDLLKVSEAQLLAFKNFGETSLREIKDILESRGMRLGIALEEKQLTPAQIADLKTIMGDKDEKILNKSIDEFNLSVRSKKCLQNLNIHTVGELICRTEAEFLGCKNFGVTSLNEIKRLLTQYGLSLRTLD